MIGSLFLSADFWRLWGAPSALLVWGGFYPGRFPGLVWGAPLALVGAFKARAMGDLVRGRFWRVVV